MTDRKVFIISECGINANGYNSIAKEQIRQSKFAGADAVKFQVYNPIELLGKDSPYLQDAVRGMFSHGRYAQLREYAYKRGIIWFASPFSVEAVDFLDGLNVEIFKVASRSVSDLKLLKSIAEKGKPVIMSVGMSNYEEIDNALKVLSGLNVTLLYCVCKYPSNKEDFDLNEIIRLKERFKLPVGFSSHCPDISVALEAVKLGATVIEQHTTVSRNLPGCDQSSSITYPELRTLVEETRKLTGDVKLPYQKSFDLIMNQSK